MNIFKYTLGPLQSNCYVITKENKCLIFDPGDAGEFIIQKINEKRLIPQAILATHGHFDHVFAVGEIQSTYNIPFYISDKDTFILNRAKETADYYLGYKNHVIKPIRIKYLKTNKIKVSNFSFDVIKTPGHTPGSICFYFKKEKWILTGDTIFKNGIGRYDFSYSNKKDLITSIDKLFNLPSDTIIYSGHGDDTTIENERRKKLI